MFPTFRPRNQNPILFYNFYISTHYKAEVVREHFGNGDDWNVSIQYIHEKEAEGIIDSNQAERLLSVVDNYTIRR